MQEIMRLVLIVEEHRKGLDHRSPLGVKFVARYTNGGKAMLGWNIEHVAQRIADELGWVQGTTLGEVAQGGPLRNEVCKKYVFSSCEFTNPVLLTLITLNLCASQAEWLV